ncbi:hypothetical protein CVD25_19420 [Bacillus canaveralius]|uniref:Uncharacterized protein n=2 Tax=Bacillus TaxID=1386 RepID=A0A2N5GIR2_9BACI|nr:hypothetical protein [Bacillus canaveralius]PLR80875.1 hypothetical protein CU635_16530 [Bacillus canaveralius]PLR91163.1 hypothetical protein CVD25_19420 [Bacillus canaveralius]
MKWQEVREIYPNQYVLLSVINARMVGNKKIIDDVALVRPIKDSQEATKELINARKDTIVYHTDNEELVIEVRKTSGLRGLRRRNCVMGTV